MVAGSIPGSVTVGIGVGKSSNCSTFCFFLNGRSIIGVDGFSMGGVMIGEGANLFGLSRVTGAGGGGIKICGL